LDITRILLIAPVLLFSMVAHEYAHGYAALRQGDPTAYQLGRLTWNPLKHIDPFMTILVPLLSLMSAGVMFGGAKPIPVVPRNYRNFKRGDIIVSLAGIATNVLLAAVATLLVVLLGLVGRVLPMANDTLSIIQLMMIYGVQVNLMLAAFNLLPIPPLDGSHVMKYLLPPAWSLQYQRIGAFGFIPIVLLLTVGGGLINGWMGPSDSLFRVALRSVTPFVLQSPWTS
jgi:Zn-dependent protease